MYRVLNQNGATIEEQSNIKYVKMQRNGTCRLCDKDDADGIVAADGETFYALKGRNMENKSYETIKVEEYVSDNAIINYLNVNADSLTEIASDVAYLAVMSELADS